MAALGIGFSLLTHSEAIMLDGLFSLLGFVMALAAIRVSKLVYEPGNITFQFGYAGFEPLFNVVKGLVIVFISLLALYSALMTIQAGGSRTEIGWALVYAITGALGCFVVAGILAHVARKSGSPLLKVDAKNWLIDGIITAAVLVGFLLVYLARGTRWEWAIPYADPMVVLVLVVLALPVPYLIIRDGVRELLLGAPDATFQQTLRQQLKSVLTDNDYKECGMRVTKTGRMLYVYVFVLLREEQADTPIIEQDRIRDALTLVVSKLYPDVEVDLFLTRNEKWVHFTQRF
jgi:cation diffusion facilitator family transporter